MYESNNYQDEYDADIDDDEFKNMIVERMNDDLFDDDDEQEELELHMMTLSDYADVVEIMNGIINLLLNMNSKQAYVFLKYVEHDYEDIADTELGDFIHDFMLTAYWSYFDHPDIDEIQSALQVLIDEQNLSSNMLITVFKDIQSIAQSIDQCKK
jgi:hypothetical protein